MTSAGPRGLSPAEPGFTAAPAEDRDLSPAEPGFTAAPAEDRDLSPAEPGFTAAPCGVVGASARAAVHSLARASISAWAIDQFADRDLKRVAACAVCPSDGYPDAIPALAAQFPPGPVLYTGGLENYPHVLRELAAARELWGNPPEVVERVRDPFTLFPTLAACGFAVPRLVPRDAPCPAEGHWLRKPLRSGGGLGICFARPGEVASPHHYFQEFIDGAPMSALYGGTTLIGVTEQLIGEPWLHATPFAYCGNIGPVAPPAVELLGKLLCEQTGLRGVWGVDFVLNDNVAYPLEVNPRYTAAVEVLEHATGAGVFRKEPNSPTPFPKREGGAPLTSPLEGEVGEALRAGWGGRASDARNGSPPTRRVQSDAATSPSRGEVKTDSPPSLLGKGDGGLGSHVAKAIYYAPHALTFPQSGPWDADLAGAFDPWRLPGFADIPEAGSAIGAGHPVLTFFATGSTPAEVRERLQSRAAELDHLFRESQP